MVSRREALLAVASGTLACRPRAASGLEVVTTGSLKEGEPGGVAVVFLHGWGAPGDDLVSLGHALAHPRARFFFPAGPLSELGGGRAWWHLDPQDRPAHAWTDQQAAGHQPHQQVAAARAAIQELLRTIQQRHRPDTLVLGGFSQGAMLSIDVALAAAPAVDRVVALSGVMLADSLPALRAPRPRKPPVFVSHGRQDPVLPFRGGESCKELLERQGYPVTWRPFEGGHEIPAGIVEEVRHFLFG
jgi:phospholipase/carboxylesterase